MADKKISELVSITGANTAADDYFVVVDTSGAVTYKISREELNNAIEQDVLENISITNLTSDLNTNGNNINFGDNDKAQFGAGSDLQIYHSGSHSFIEDTGTGNLYLATNGTSVRITKGPQNAENMAAFNPDGSAILYYDNAAKIATTATGVDVTGGLITTGNVGIGTSSPTAKVTLGGSGDQYINRAVEDGSIILSGGQGVYGGYTSGGFIARGSTSTYNQSGIELYTGGAERMRITTDKVQFNVDAKVDVDNAHDLGSGGARWKDLYLSGGVIFGATGGTVTSKTLDDYEEGTWTPAYSTSGGSFAYDSATQGQYTKIGNMVTVYFRIYTTSATVGTGNVSITGLPFAEAFTNGTLGGSIGDCRLFAGDTPSEIGVYNSELLLWYRTSANGANTRLQASDLGTGFIDNLIDGQITYVTS